MKYSNNVTTRVYGSATEDESSFDLQPGERITKIHVRHGYLVDSLCFFTNFGNELGPFGGGGGSVGVLEPPENSASFLATVSGVEVHSQMGWRTINRLQFTWGYYGLEEKEDALVEPEIHSYMSDEESYSEDASDFENNDPEFYSDPDDEDEGELDEDQEDPVIAGPDQNAFFFN